MADKQSIEAAELQIEPSAVKKPELGDLIVEYLEALGVEYIFGVPGGAIEPLYNAMARSARRGGLRPIVARHEAGAAFMADGYARETGKLGVCCSTTGPGATNLITGVASAYMDKVPMLVLTAQTALHRFGKWAFQESSCTAVNTVSMFQDCTRFSSLVSHRGQLEGKLLSAILAAQGPPAGPAHLSLPPDILSSHRRQHPREYIPNLQDLLKQSPMANLQALDLLCKEITKSSKIVLIIGEDCGEAISEILEFAELVKAQIVSGPTGKRWMNHTHPQYLGVLGFAGHSSATAAFIDDETDLILAVGTRFSHLIFSKWEDDEKLLEKVIHIDPTPEHFSRSPQARLHVCGTMSHIFRGLVMRLWNHGSSKKIKSKRIIGESSRSQISVDLSKTCQTSSSLIKPQRLMVELANKLPDSTRFLIDTGSSWAWSIHYLLPRSSGLFRASMNFGAMGWAIGASVGTALSSNGSPVVCITGDGSWLMNGQEITVAVAEKLPVIFVVLNDRALGMVKHGQRLGGAEQVAFELPQVDFALMATATGARGISVRTIDDLVRLNFEEICRQPGPTLLDVHIDPEEIPPIGITPRKKSL